MHELQQNGNSKRRGAPLNPTNNFCDACGTLKHTCPYYEVVDERRKEIRKIKTTISDTMKNPKCINRTDISHINAAYSNIGV